VSLERRDAHRELIMELQVGADQHIMVFVVKVRRNLFPNFSPWGALAAQ
jgi:hypothetical protein